jgi:hypothetical protein
MATYGYLWLSMALQQCVHRPGPHPGLQRVGRGLATFSAQLRATFSAIWPDQVQTVRARNQALSGLRGEALRASFRHKLGPPGSKAPLPLSLIFRCPGGCTQLGDVHSCQALRFCRGLVGV